MSAVTFEKRGHVAIATIDRPEARNALSPEVLVRLDRCWTQVRDDDEVAILIGNWHTATAHPGDTTF